MLLRPHHMLYQDVCIHDHTLDVNCHPPQQVSRRRHGWRRWNSDGSCGYIHRLASPRWSRRSLVRGCCGRIVIEPCVHRQADFTIKMAHYICGMFPCILSRNFPCILSRNLYVILTPKLHPCWCTTIVDTIYVTPHQNGSTC